MFKPLLIKVVWLWLDCCESPFDKIGVFIESDNQAKMVKKVTKDEVEFR